MDGSPRWDGAFPINPLITLLDENRKFNLAESTVRDLSVDELLSLVDQAQLKNIRMGYGTSAGLPELREIVARQCGVDPELVVTTTGCALGLALLAFGVFRPGDEAIIATPCFPPSLDLLLARGMDVTRLPLSFDTGYRLDLERLRALASDSTRFISIASPQNPTGIVLRDDEVAELIDLIDRRAPNALLLIDETYRHAGYGEHSVRRSLANLHPRVITGSSISKAHGAPGLRVGWLTVPDRRIRDYIITAKMSIVISGSELCEALAACLLGHPEIALRSRQILLTEGLAKVEEWMAGEPRFEWVRPDAGGLCCVRFRAGIGDDVIEAFWDRLAVHELQLARGDWFGDDPRVFRLGFGYLPLERLDPALQAISNALDAAEVEVSAGGLRQQANGSLDPLRFA